MTESAAVVPPVRPRVIIKAFDGLRAFAIGLVVFHHLLPDDVLGGGVEAFFVLSGFLITSILIRESSRSGRIDYRRFLWHRLLRLYPALLATVVVVSAGLVISGHLRFAVEQAGVALTYLFDIWLPVTGRPIGPLGHTWSLGLEQQFYLTWPFVVLFLMLKLKRPSSRFAVAAGFALVTLALQIALYTDERNFSPPERMAPIAVGCALAFGLAARRITLHRAFLWLAAGLFVALTLLVDVAGVLPRDFVRPSATLCAAVAVWVLATAADRKVGLLTHPVTVHIGLISYGLFLWHFPLFYLLFRSGAPLWLTALIGLPATWLLAEASRRFIEVPASRYKDRPVPRPWRRRTTAAAPTAVRVGSDAP